MPTARNAHRRRARWRAQLHPHQHVPSTPTSRYWLRDRRRSLAIASQGSIESCSDKPFITMASDVIVPPVVAPVPTPTEISAAHLWLNEPSRVVPIDSAPDSALVVMVHVYQYELWPELDVCLRRAINVPFALYVTLAYDASSEIAERERQRDEILRAHPAAQVLLHENRGMDCGGFLVALHDLQQRHESRDAYQYVLKLHSKSDVEWRRAMLDALLRNSETFQHALALLHGESTIHDLHDADATIPIGMVGCAAWCLTSDAKDPHAEHLSTLLTEASMPSWPADSAFRFIGGTIFLARLDLLRAWADHVDLEALCARLLPGKPDDYTVPHSIERLFGALVYRGGAQVVGIEPIDNEQFDAQYYLSHNKDVHDSGYTPEQAREHWECYGRWEGRRHTPH